MKKLAASVLLIITSGMAHALPVGNPAEASLFLNGVWWEGYSCEPYDPCFSWCESWSFRLGFAGDYVFNRHMEVINQQRGNIDTTTLNTNAGYLALNFCDRFDLFGRLGASKIHIRTDARSWGSNASLESELGFQTYLSWGVGARATIWGCECFAIGVEGEYFQTVPDFEYFLNYNDGTLTYFNDNANAFYSEWQVGIGASYRFSTSCPTLAFVPYVSVKWARSKLELNNFQFLISSPSTQTLTLGDLRAKKLWGYAVGATFTLCDMVGVTVEGRFADEKALYVNGQFRF